MENTRTVTWISIGYSADSVEVTGPRGHVHLVVIAVKGIRGVVCNGIRSITALTGLNSRAISLPRTTGPIQRRLEELIIGTGQGYTEGLSRSVVAQRRSRTIEVKDIHGRRIGAEEPPVFLRSPTRPEVLIEELVDVGVKSCGIEP